ncbi:MAG TPA: T9SS type A sorting domain-containing protein [Bacteroidetes bacterium]|nr:T9SS type A sorting domain-containing protein [Bacteroidota bacterium]
MAWTHYSVNLGQNYFALLNLDPCTQYTVELAIRCNKVYSNVCTVTFTTGGCLKPGDGPKKTVFNETPVVAFPNPFSEKLTLEFGIEEAGEVTVVLHDLLGKELYRHTGRYGAGNTHQLSIDGQHLPTGLLFYTLETPAGRKTGRVIKQ